MSVLRLAAAAAVCLLPVTAVSTAASTAAVAAPGGTVPTAVTVEGELQRLVVDTFDDHEHELALVVEPDGQAVRVRAEDVEAVPTGASVEVSVDPSAPEGPATDPDGGAVVLDLLSVQDGPTDAPSDVAAAAEPQLAELAATTRTVHVLTTTLPGQSADTVTPAMLAAEVDQRVRPYWRDSTSDTVSFVSGRQLAAPAYTAWGDTATCTGTQINAFLRWTAAQAEFTIGTGVHSMTYTPRFPACGFAGVAHLAQGGAGWLNGASSATSRWHVMAHELGHTLELGHSNARTGCAAGADGAAQECRLDAWGRPAGAYGDAYDVMGAQIGDLGPLGAAHLDVLGVRGSMVTATGPTTVTLAPVAGGSGTRSLRFTTGGATYYVELRGAVGRDADLATSRRGCPTTLSPCDVVRYTPGVVVHRADTTAGRGRDSFLLDAGGNRSFVLPAGGTMTTADGAYMVTVESVTGTGARVRLSVPTAPPPGPDPAAGAVYRPVFPERVLPQRQVGPGGTVTFTVPGVPVGATAVALNVTAAGVRQTSYVSACAAGTPVEQCRATSALNPSAGVDTAAAVVVALGGPGKDQVTLYNNAGTLGLLADVQGFFVGTSDDGGELVARSPLRVMDARLGTAQATTLTLPGVPASATAVAVNVTTSGATARTYVSVCPAGQPVQACSASSTINPDPSRDTANLAVVRLGGARGDALTVYNNRGDVNVKLDVVGYFVDAAARPAGGGRYHAATPTRVLDRHLLGEQGAHTLRVPVVPAGATAVAMNLTATSAGAVTYVSACPGGTTVAACRTTSVFNPLPRVDTSNSTLVGLGGVRGDEVLLYNNRSGIRLIADVQGYFHPAR